MEVDGVETTDYSEDGVDLILIRWFRTLTPVQRIEVLQGQIESFVEIRRLNGWPDSNSANPQLTAGRVHCRRWCQRRI